MASNRPSGTVAFLFTDIEGSTRLWEECGEEMADALARHDVIVRGALDEHGGYVFATGGDGFAAAFASSTDALAAATAAQRTLAEEPWGRAVIRVRMGLHVGEAHERDGDYFGPALNRAARIMAAGHGGQILASQAFAEVCASGDLVDLGEHQLRDLSGAQRIHQVGTGVFPGIRSIDAFPSNLPRQLSTFVGREAQVEQLVSDLRSNDLVTLTGTGGVGKTRLAVQASAEALPKFPDGAWFVDLSTIRDPAQLPDHIAKVLEVKERAEEPLTTTLRDRLQQLRAVIVLDNGEHVVDALADLVVELLSRELAASLLITSREPLGLDGELVRRVSSLSSTEAQDLFAQRAADVRADLDFDQQRADVAEICARLDGIPLAVELAAARSRSMSPRDILERLDERFRLLSGGRRRARERHQTLLATVEWSYDLLDPDERTLFDRLAVFNGGFSLEAAEAVCSGDPIDPLDVVDLLDRLVDKSMALAYSSGGRSRYRLLETLRQFAESRLVDSGTADELRERHLGYYSQLVDRWSPMIRSADQELALLELAAERANLNAALEYLAECERWEDFQRLFSKPMGLWTTSAAPDGVRWSQQLVDHIADLDPQHRPGALATAAYVISNAGGFARGAAIAERSIEAANDAGSEPTPQAWYCVAQWRACDGDLLGGVAAADEGALLARDGSDTFMELACASHGVTGRLYLDAPDAGQRLVEFVSFAEGFAMPTILAVARSAQGIQHSLNGEHVAAERYFAQALDIAGDLVPHIVIQTCRDRALGRFRAGAGEVIDSVREALDVFADYPVQPEQVADIWALVAAVWLAEGRQDDAAVLAAAAASLLTSLGTRGREETAWLREKLGDDLATRLSPEELDSCIASAAEMTAADVHRFILERI